MQDVDGQGCGVRRMRSQLPRRRKTWYINDGSLIVANQNLRHHSLAIGIDTLDFAD
jgi:hypothetical protein